MSGKRHLGKFYSYHPFTIYDQKPASIFWMPRWSRKCSRWVRDDWERMRLEKPTMTARHSHHCYQHQRNYDQLDSHQDHNDYNGHHHDAVDHSGEVSQGRTFDGKFRATNISTPTRSYDDTHQNRKGIVSK